MKTTNAKAKAFQTPGPALEKEPEKTIAPLTSARRPKRVIHGDTVKLQVHGDESPLVEREVEYCPPRPKDLPYQSEDFPEGCLNYNVLKPGNLMRGIHNTYYNEIDDNGLTRMDREYEESYKKSARECDERIMKMMEEDWTVGDIPETFNLKKKNAQLKVLMDKNTTTTTIPTKGPATIISRKAASALSVIPKSTAAPPKPSNPIPKPTTSFLTRAKPASRLPPPSTMRHNAAAAASRSTLGYTKGRTASGVLQRKETSAPAPVIRSVSSNLSQASDTTITPTRFAKQDSNREAKLPWLNLYTPDDDGLESDCELKNDEDEEEFVLTLGTGS
jgi:hypothetical protein